MTEDPSSNRDFYLLYMKSQNPDYSLFSRKELHDAVLDAPRMEKGSKSGTSSHPHPCATQEHGSVASIYLGVEKGVLHLWENGSQINWTCRKDGWPSPKCAQHALLCMWSAASEWNKVMDGRVKFKYVSRLADAAMEVRYQKGWRRKLLATAFFPADYEKDLNFLKIYRGAFDPEMKEHFPLFNTLLHELGHVLGMRHEFAHKRERFSESILFGVTNDDSVMAYKPKLRIQPSDIHSIRKAYDELKHDTVVTAEGPYGEVSKRIIRVKPNN